MDKKVSTNFLKRKYSIRWNLLWDLIGKDSQRGVSLSYAYLANQLGHFSLGFIPSILFGLWTHNEGLSSLIVGGFWSIFEIINFYIQQKKSGGHFKDLFRGFISQLSTFLTFNMKKSYNIDDFFKFNSWNVVGDTILDIFFFSIGSICAYLALCGAYYFVQSPVFSTIIILSFIYGIGWFGWWYKKKIYLQNAEFPGQMRMANWYIENDKKLNGMESNFNLFIKQFIPKNEDDESLGIGKMNKIEELSKNIFIGGPAQLGKTDLAISVGTELVLNFHKKVRYFTFIDFLENYCLRDSNETDRLEKILIFHDVIIIDEINAGCNFNQVTGENTQNLSLNTPDKLIKFITPIIADSQLLKLFKSKVFIFVIGLEKNYKLEEYRNGLVRLFYTKEDQMNLNAELSSDLKNIIEVIYKNDQDDYASKS